MSRVLFVYPILDRSISTWYQSKHRLIRSISLFANLSHFPSLLVIASTHTRIFSNFFAPSCHYSLQLALDCPHQITTHLTSSHVPSNAKKERKRRKEPPWPLPTRHKYSENAVVQVPGTGTVIAKIYLVHLKVLICHRYTRCSKG